MTLNRCAKYGEMGLWIRSVYKEGFLNQSIKAVIRPGDRSSFADYRHIKADIDIPVRFIKKPGEGAEGGELFPDDGTTVRRTGMLVKKIKELTAEDLHGMAPDSTTPELVRYHLATLYNTELPSPEDVVTIWQFEYRPKAI